MDSSFVQWALGALNIVLGGSLLGAYLKFRSDKAKINSDTLIAMRGHDIGEEEAEGNYWEKLILSYDKRLRDVEAKLVEVQAVVEAKDAHIALVEREKLVLEKNNNIQSIYIDTLVNTFPNPPGAPTRPNLVN